MCGIIAVLRPPPGAVVTLDAPAVLGLLAAGRRRLEVLGDMGAFGEQQTVAALATTVPPLHELDALLKSPAGICALVADAGLRHEVGRQAAIFEGWLVVLEERLDRGELAAGSAAIEELNRLLVALKDAVWAIGRDRVGAAVAVAELAGELQNPAAIVGLLSVQQVLSGLDRLEVRGRDSAGVQIVLHDHGVDPAAPLARQMLAHRLDDPLYRGGAVRFEGGALALVYKTAAEIGELGDNVRELRRAIREDQLLRLALGGDNVSVLALGHTRWASVGIISEQNAHPLDERESPARSHTPMVVGALNGDVDNHLELKAAADLRFPSEVTTDAKVIPALVARRLVEGWNGVDAFRETVASFVGSVAIAASVVADPDILYLALHGSGQALYVGLGEGVFVVASEPYGVVEETETYLRLDGETPADTSSPATSRGQIVVLDRRRAGRLEGILRVGYDGTVLPVTDRDLHRAQITTRDIDRRGYPHFLLKEISEAPASFAKTLRGKLLEAPDGVLRVALGEDVLPTALRERLRSGAVRRILVIGQGTAAVAGQGVAEALRLVLTGRPHAPAVLAMPATELSGFHLDSDMSDALVVAISQSGTTTDTNRTVDLVRARGATVVAIVNRRSSDLTDKADGVLYTSDGRDVEMSVASTKAFYSQIAGGFLLAIALGELYGGEGTLATDAALQELARGLRGELPAAMASTIERRADIAAIAERRAPPKRHWALVGNGWNRIAAQEVRIKLSELCYKSIACDVTEDKKHIDLSSEPLVLVCAAGLVGSNADDVAKEIAIFAAHKATPIVFATEGERRFTAAAEIFEVPRVHPALSFVLSAVAGHLFGYAAALAIDAQARPLRELRAAIERLASGVSAPIEQDGEPEDPLERLRREAGGFATAFQLELAARRYDGHLEASTAVVLSELLQVVDGTVGLDEHARRRRRTASPAALIDDLVAALNRAIDELTRPVDAIKHQAKTVTVGISRAEEALVTVPLVRDLLAAGALREQIAYSDLRALAALDPLVAEVRGFTRYRLEGDPGEESASIRVTGRGGVALGMASRTEHEPALKGTKRRVAEERRLLVARGERDGRMFVLVPEQQDGRAVGLTLLHLDLHERAPASALRGALRAYHDRYARLRDAVMETESEFRDELLDRLSVEEALLEPVETLARSLRLRAGMPTGAPSGVRA
ncbi:MAG TPA: SIS domain-containing protein [Thermoanaerobaculia bacterium]|nr:SIS domain-containing protein [Thermoanaerobaculia bacterium]